MVHPPIIVRWRIGPKLRALRKRRGWRQQDLGDRIGCSREVISRIENDRLDTVPLGKIQACVDALGAYLRMDVQWQGERLPRLMDARHAALQNRFVEMLESLGWTMRVEVSFNHYGERGRIDILAWHGATGALAVVEIKPQLGDAQDTLGRLDIKVRLANQIAAEIGWIVTSVVAVLVLEEGTTQRRQVEEHKALFSGLGLRGRAGVGWLRRPTHDPVPTGLLLFIKSPDSHSNDTRQRRIA